MMESQAWCAALEHHAMETLKCFGQYSRCLHWNRKSVDCYALSHENPTHWPVCSCLFVSSPIVRCFKAYLDRAGLHYLGVGVSSRAVPFFFISCASCRGGHVKKMREGERSKIMAFNFYVWNVNLFCYTGWIINKQVFSDFCYDCDCWCCAPLIISCSLELQCCF